MEDKRQEVASQEARRFALDSNGLQVAGYRVPLWLLLFVIAVVGYYCYQKGCFAGLFGEPHQVMTFADPTVLNAPIDVVDTPAIVRRLFQ